MYVRGGALASVMPPDSWLFVTGDGPLGSQCSITGDGPLGSQCSITGDGPLGFQCGGFSACNSVVCGTGGWSVAGRGSIPTN